MNDTNPTPNAQAESKGLALEMFGFTREELQDRVVEQIAEQVMRGVSLDEDGNEYQRDSSFSNRLKTKIQERINTTIQALGEKHVLPNVTAYIEKLTLEETTKWGEKKGNPVTFIEYLANRADAYMRDLVDYEGQSKDEKRDSYGWSGKQTRVTYIIHKHIQYSINTAMEKAVKSVDDQIAQGIAKTVEIELANILAKLKPAVPQVTK